jgi:TPR repeat protein
MHIFKSITLVLAVALTSLSGQAVLAQDMDKGFLAYYSNDYATALKEWQPLADQGHAEAQSGLGRMYFRGEGVLQNFTEAVKWYRLAAIQGYAAAQLELGTMYFRGEGVLQDYVRSHNWYNIAAANGARHASEWRDLISARMTSADISEAQALARECMSSGYMNCE